VLAQALAWVATFAGLASTWQTGKKRKSGWVFGIACSVLWVVVNAQVGLVAGVVSSIIAGTLAVKNWLAWRKPKGSVES